MTYAEREVYERQVKDTLIALGPVALERRRQTKLFGEQNHTHEEWLRILIEEVGEVARALNEDDSVEHLCEELTQVAAVAVAWVETVNRSKE